MDSTDRRRSRVMISPADMPQQRVDPNSELNGCAGFGFLRRGGRKGRAPYDHITSTAVAPPLTE